MIVAADLTFAKRLRALRASAGLKQTELADRSGLTKQAISLLENGTNQPSWDTVLKLARGLNLPVTAFDPESATESVVPEPPPPPIPPRRFKKK